METILHIFYNSSILFRVKRNAKIIIVVFVFAYAENMCSAHILFIEWVIFCIACHCSINTLFKFEASLNSLTQLHLDLFQWYLAFVDSISLYNMPWKQQWYLDQEVRSFMLYLLEKSTFTYYNRSYHVFALLIYHCIDNTNYFSRDRQIFVRDV